MTQLGLAGARILGETYTTLGYETASVANCDYAPKSCLKSPMMLSSMWMGSLGQVHQEGMRYSAIKNNRSMRKREGGMWRDLVALPTHKLLDALAAYRASRIDFSR